MRLRVGIWNLCTEGRSSEREWVSPIGRNSVLPMARVDMLFSWIKLFICFFLIRPSLSGPLKDEFRPDSNKIYCFHEWRSLERATKADARLVFKKILLSMLNDPEAGKMAQRDIVQLMPIFTLNMCYNMLKELINLGMVIYKPLWVPRILENMCYLREFKSVNFIIDEVFGPLDESDRIKMYDISVKNGYSRLFRHLAYHKNYKATPKALLENVKKVHTDHYECLKTHILSSTDLDESMEAAIKMNNWKAVLLFMLKGTHKKSVRALLRLALKKKSFDVVSIIASHPSVTPSILTHQIFMSGVNIDSSFLPNLQLLDKEPAEIIKILKRSRKTLSRSSVRANISTTFSLNRECAVEKMASSNIGKISKRTLNSWKRFLLMRSVWLGKVEHTKTFLENGYHAKIPSELLFAVAVTSGNKEIYSILVGNVCCLKKLNQHDIEWLLQLCLVKNVSIFSEALYELAVEKIQSLKEFIEDFDQQSKDKKMYWIDISDFIDDLSPEHPKLMELVKQKLSRSSFSATLKSNNVWLPNEIFDHIMRKV